MCKGIIGGSEPKVQPLPPEPQRANKVDAAAKTADKERRRLRSGFGSQSTIATSPLGLNSQTSIAGKSLLGQ